MCQKEHTGGTGCIPWLRSLTEQTSYLAVSSLRETPSLFPGGALGQGHFPEWNFVQLRQVLPSLVARQ